MNKTKILFTLSILGILSLLIILLQTKPIIQGQISKIEYSSEKISISLAQEDVKLIVFTKRFLNIKEGEFIKVYGKEEVYKTQKQIIVDKIVKI